MTKKERKELEEKMIDAITDSVKLQGHKTTDAFLKSVKKHSKVLAKKLMKELTIKVSPLTVKKTPSKASSIKRDAKSSAVKATPSKKAPLVRRKSNA